MEGAMSVDPKPEQINGSEVLDEDRQQQPHQANVMDTSKSDDDGGGRMEIDSRGNARGQTEEQIKAQEKRVKEIVGLWSSSGIKQ